MDITVVVTRLGIFLSVYALVLGVPYFVGKKYPNNWIMSVSLMGVLATMGPLIYLFFQKKAEDKLLEEQRQYQSTLRQASLGMGQIKDFKKVVKFNSTCCKSSS